VNFVRGGMDIGGCSQNPPLLVMSLRGYLRVDLPGLTTVPDTTLNLPGSRGLPGYPAVGFRRDARAACADS
jgi:hypothetical protein